MRRCATRTGFTLIEALTAVAVLVIILPVISAGFAAVTDAAGMVRDRARATAIAEEHLEQLVADGSWQYGMTGGDENGMHWEPALTDWEGDGYTELLTVTVNWTHRNRPVTLSLSTVVYAQGSATQSSSGITGLGIGGTP